MSLYVLDRLVVVAGDGKACDERASRLTAAGARLFRVPKGAYRSHMCQGAFAVIANDADHAFNEAVARDARAAGALSYAHDNPAWCDFAMPALVRRGPLTIAIATDAAAPVLARRLRQELERLLEGAAAGLDRLIERLERRRAQLPPGARASLGTIAARLRIEGRLVIDDDDDDQEASTASDAHRSPDTR